jgi:hypothetical protein
MQIAWATIGGVFVVLASGTITACDVHGDCFDDSSESLSLDEAEPREPLSLIQLPRNITPPTQAHAAAPTVSSEVLDANTTTSVTLLGTVGFIMVIFYMVNSPIQLIAANAWRMMSSTVSIFCAVLTYGAASRAINATFGLVVVDGPPTTTLIISSAVQLLVWWIFVTMILFFAKGSLLHLKGYGTIGGHIMGFAAIHVCGQVATMRYFTGSPSMTLIVIGIYFVAIPLVFLPTILLRHMIAASTDTAVVSAWHDQSKDTAVDFVCMGGSFLFSMWIRFLILGHVPSIEAESTSHSTHHALVLAGVGGGLLVFGALLIKLHHWSNLDGLFDFLSTMTSLTAAFCLIFSAHWYVFAPLHGNSMIARTGIALVCSLVAVAFVLLGALLIGCLHCDPRPLRGAFSGLSLAVGLSWEKVFDASLEGLGGLGASTTDITMSMVVLVLVVFPAWMVYMLPKADFDLQKAMSKCLAKGSLPLSAVFCDHNLYDDALPSRTTAETMARSTCTCCVQQ